MTSGPSANFAFGSASSAQSVKHAIASYRRAQYLLAGSAVCSASDSYDPLDDAEASISSQNEQLDVDLVATAETIGRRSGTEDLIGQFEWDDLEEELDVDSTPRLPILIPSTIPKLSPAHGDTRLGAMEERAPLLRKISFSNAPHPRYDDSRLNVPILPTHQLSASQHLSQLRRRSSGASTKSLKYAYGGQSTYGQTLFNSIAILLGIGMLSEPLAFSYAGWFAGTLIIIFYGFISCYTAKILARIILSDPRLRSYSDIGCKAFGPRSTVFINFIFCLELFTVSVVLVTLYADSLHTIIPTYSADTYKIWGLAILLPTVFLPLSLLSYASILGILSILLLIAVIMIDGFSKVEAPGSLWSPASTSFGIKDWDHLGLAFGLFMAGFSGHAVIPSLARDMIDPTQFDPMINWAFVIATAIYTIIGYAGYLMFGNFVSEEISMDLLKTPGYNPLLNQAALWMLVVSPLTKFALATQPLNATLEVLMGIDSPVSSLEDFPAKSSPLGTCPVLKRVVHIAQRVLLTLLSVGISILVPEFSAVMAFLGSFSAFMICVIGPIGAKVGIEGRCGLFDAIALMVAIIMATWGTLVAFKQT